ncbi:MAG: response regulator, partial [Bacteroidota bacterium]|nr:response regulator [Bacteroidota bacterium]
MDIPIRILIIEDSETDRELLLHELKRGGYTVEYLCVETAEAMNAALDFQEWDIIISDYSLPHFDGLSALKIVKKRNIDIPF